MKRYIIAISSNGYDNLQLSVPAASQREAAKSLPEAIRLWEERNDIAPGMGFPGHTITLAK